VNRRWLKIPLVVAGAFGFTMLVEVLGKSSAQAGHETPLLWAILMSPGWMPADHIAVHLRIPLLMWFDIDAVPQVLVRWLAIAFNTLFYSGLFWLVSMFVTEARQPKDYSTKGLLKAITARVLLAAAIALLLGMAAELFLFEGTCWLGGGTDCAAYSPTKIWIAFLLAPPIFLLQPGLLIGKASPVNPLLQMLGLPTLVAYYFGLISVARLVIRRFRESKMPLAITVVVLLAVSVLSRIVVQHPATRNRTTCEAFIAGVAVDFGYPELCSKIPVKATENGGFNAGVISLRSECIERSGGHWGSPGTLIEITDDDLANLMRQLGYTNQALDDAHVYPADNSAWRRYLDILRDPQHMLWKRDVAPGQLQRARFDFLNRVKNLECKDK
jgi:hypothetical protein